MIKLFNEHEVSKKTIKIWIDALRSGKYKQTKERLQDHNGYCCLGVACDLFIPKDKLEVNGQGFIDGGTPWRQHNSPNWLSYINEHFADIYGDTLSGINDKGSTFEEIADLLEQYYIKG